MNSNTHNATNHQSPPMALAISGRIASGKSSLAEGLAHALGCKRASFGDYVRSIAAERGIDLSRVNLQELGARLAEKPFEFCAAVLNHAGWEPGQAVVIDGVRHSEILRVLRRIVDPITLKLIFVVVDDEVRRERIAARSGGMGDVVKEVELHSTERQVDKDIRGVADLVIDGAKDPNQLVREVFEWVSIKYDGPSE